LDASRTGELIYDWNREIPQNGRAVEFDDETLRDGLQSPSVRNPPVEEKLRLLHLMEELRIDCADLGLPGAGPRARADVLALATEIARNRMRILPDCAARTHIPDILPVAEVSQAAGIPIEVSLFIGSSQIRRVAEDWDLADMLKRSTEAIRFAKQHRLPVMYVTEDTTRAHPDVLEALYGAAIAEGVERVCLADTTGHATPEGARRLTTFIRELVRRSGRDVKIDWHGHMDRGLGVLNSIAAWDAGADRLHGTALGVGERVGNTPIDLLLVNFRLMGVITHSLLKLTDYVNLVSRAVGIPIPINYPVFGKDAFETATGVHASAVVKALKKGDLWLANRVYSAVPADEFGRSQVISVGPMSGRSNVTWWLESRALEATEDRVKRILEASKRSDHILSEQEIRALV